MWCVFSPGSMRLCHASVWMRTPSCGARSLISPDGNGNGNGTPPGGRQAGWQLGRRVGRWQASWQASWQAGTHAGFRLGAGASPFAAVPGIPAGELGPLPEMGEHTSGHYLLGEGAPTCECATPPDRPDISMDLAAGRPRCGRPDRISDGHLACPLARPLDVRCACGRVPSPQRGSSHSGEACGFPLEQVEWSGPIVEHLDVDALEGSPSE